MEIRELKLGMKLKDTITGFEGTATSSHFYLNGCVRVSIQSSTLKDGKPLDPESFDIQQLEAIQEAVATSKAKSGVGGPHPIPAKRAIPKVR